MIEEIKELTKRLVNNGDINLRLAMFKDLNGLLEKTSVPDVCQDENAGLLSQLILDLQSENEDLLMTIVSILERFLAEKDSTSFFSDEQTSEILEHVLDIVSQSKCTLLVQSALRLLANQHFNATVVETFVDSVLTAVNITMTSAATERVDVISRMLEQCPEKMEEHMSIWVKPMLVFSASNEATCRQHAVASLTANLPILLKHRKSIIVNCAATIKQEVVAKLKPLSTSDDGLQEILTLQLPLYMSFVGEYFKKSSALINSLLQFVEKGFRHAKDDIKLSAFKAWGFVIDCFASNKDVLSSAKYIKLLTQPFKMKLKSKELTKARLVTMWKLAICLDDRLPDLFEIICKPLLEMCFSSATSCLKQRRSSTRLSQGMFSQSNVPDEDMQELGAEILAHLLLNVDNVNHAFSLNEGRFTSPFIGTPTNFARFHIVLVPAICHVICNLSESLPSELHVELWNVMLTSAQDCVSRKRDTDLFRSLFQAATRIVNNSRLPADSLLKFVASLTKFPNKVLNSNLHCASGRQSGMLHNSPVLTIFELLVSSPIATSCVNNPDMLRCAEAIISCGMERTLATLEFVHAVVKLLTPKHVVYLRMWKVLADAVLKNIDQTSNVNQGDSLEHDFSSMYSLVLFPVQFVLKSESSDVEFIDDVIDSWRALSDKFFELTAMVETAEPEESRCHVASRVLHKLTANPEQVFDAATSKFMEAAATSVVRGAQFQEKHPAKRRHSAKGKFRSTAGDFNDIVVKLITHLVTINPHRQSVSVPVNVFPSLLEVFTNLPQSLVLDFFFSFVPVIQGTLPEESDMIELYQRDVEAFWKQLTLRLPYSPQLITDKSACEVFIIAFQESTPLVARYSAQFWELKALDAFDPASAPEELLAVLSDVYKEHGLRVSWKEVKDAENATFNVSASSNQSAFEDEEMREVIEDSLSTSDATDQHHADDDSESDDITQLSSNEMTSPMKTDTSLTEYDDSSPGSVQNRSLNLRKLANSSDGNNACIASEFDDSFREKSVYEVAKTAELSVYTSAPTSPASEHDSSAALETSADASVYEAVEMAEISINQTLPLEHLSSTSAADRSSIESDVDKSVYELVEMAEMSVNQSPPPASLVSASCNSDDADKSVYEAVEMVEMSINQSPPAESSVIESDDPDKSVYEVVEMAEMSVNQASYESPSRNSDQSVVNDDVFAQATTVDTSVNSSPRDVTPRSDAGDKRVDGKVRSAEKSSESATDVHASAGDIQFNEPSVAEATFEEQCARDLGVQPLDSSFEVDPEEQTSENEEFTTEGSYGQSAGSDSSLDKDPDVTADSRTANNAGRQSTNRRRSRRSRSPSAKLVSMVAAAATARSKPRAVNAAKPQTPEPPLEIHAEVAVAPERMELNDVPADAVVEVRTERFCSIESALPTLVLTKVDSKPAAVRTEPEPHVQAKGNGESDKEPPSLSEQTSASENCESPQTSGKGPEVVDTPRSCTSNRLALLREQSISSPVSPSGILKRRLSEFPSPANKLRRVSFAEPISTSSNRPDGEMIPLSPESSPHGERRKNKFSHRIVNRRLSLPAPKRAHSGGRGDEVRSLMSVRSAAVAAAIADIKARNTEATVADQPSPSSRTSTIPETTSPVTGSQSIRKMLVSQLNDSDYLNGLPVNQLSHLMETVLLAAPVVHSVLMQKLMKK